jgi:hypothetical protein
MRVLNIVLGMISLIGLIIGILILLPAISEQQKPACDNMSARNTVTHSYTPIFSTGDGTAVRGSFFLGCGRIDTYMVYLFYTGDDKNGFQRQMIDSRNVYIFRDSDNPYMLKKTTWKMMPLSPAGSMCTPVDIVELHVPKDTINRDVDL